MPVSRLCAISEVRSVPAGGPEGCLAQVPREEKGREHEGKLENPLCLAHFTLLLKWVWKYRRFFSIITPGRI